MKKILRKQFMAVLVVLLGAFLACSNGTTKKETVTKNVTVTFPAYTPGVSDSISFAPTYTPDSGWEHFSPSDITYTVICAELTKTYNSSNSFTANISDGYTDGSTYTFAQTFKMGNTVVGSQVIEVEVGFGVFLVLKDTSGANLSPQAIPPVNLTLSKEVSK